MKINKILFIIIFFTIILVFAKIALASTVEVDQGSQKINCDEDVFIQIPAETFYGNTNIKCESIKSYDGISIPKNAEMLSKIYNWQIIDVKNKKNIELFRKEIKINIKKTWQNQNENVYFYDLNTKNWLRLESVSQFDYLIAKPVMTGYFAVFGETTKNQQIDYATRIVYYIFTFCLIIIIGNIFFVIIKKI